MSSPGRRELALALALAAGEGVPPGVLARGAPQIPCQRVERRERRRWPVLAKGEIAAPLVRRDPGGAEALRAPGDQDEIGRGRRIRGEAASVVVDEQATVEAFAQVHATAGVRAAVRAARDLDEARPEPDGVVARDATRVAAAEAIGEIARGAAPRGVGRGGRAREAAVVVDEIGREIGLGGLDGVQAGEPELGDEAVLPGFPEAFDAALGLGRVLPIQRTPFSVGALVAPILQASMTAMARGRSRDWFEPP
jgi:hypothetical protein